MATFTLDALKEQVAKKYSPVVITAGDDEFSLENILQLPEKKRKQVEKLTAVLDDDSEDLDVMLGTFKDIIRAIEKNDRGDDLLELVGDNSALLMEIALEWMDSTQVGEAGQS